MESRDDILRRIDYLLENKSKVPLESEIGELVVTTVTLFQSLYGIHSTQLEVVKTMQKQVFDVKSERRLLYQFRSSLHGYLQALKSDLTEGRIVNLQAEARGEVFGDFIALARRALDQGEKDVAAVLACAALEDSLKQYAKSHGVDVGDKEMATVVRALKSVGAIDSTEGAVLKGYTQVRNKTFHAQWDAIDVPEVKGVIAYTEEFLIKRFSNQPLE